MEVDSLVWLKLYPQPLHLPRRLRTTAIAESKARYGRRLVGRSIHRYHIFSSLKDRIVGGTAAGKEEWPWQVLLADISSSGAGNHYCGATLLSPTWVIIFFLFFLLLLLFVLGFVIAIPQHLGYNSGALHLSTAGYTIYF